MKVFTHAPTIASSPRTRQNPPAQDAYHPPVDWWQLGEDRLSTQQLLKSNQVDTTGVQASYHYKLEASDEHSGKPRNILAAAAAGAAVGAVTAGGGATVLAIIGEFLSILNPYSRGSGINTGFVLGAAALGAAVGGVVGGAGMLEQGRLEDQAGTVIEGRLRSEIQPDGSNRLAFYPGGSVDRRVDVNAYAQTDELPEVPIEPRAWWKDSLVGAGLGAALAPGTMVPLVGIFAPAAVGYQAGDALTDGEAYGQVLGAAAGIGVTAGTIWAGNTLGLVKGFGIMAGATGAVGAALAPVVLPKMRQRTAEQELISQQWWHKPPQP